MPEMDHPTMPLPDRQFRSVEYQNPREQRDDHALMKVYRQGEGYYGENGQFDFEAKDAEECRAKLTRWGFTRRTN